MSEEKKINDAEEKVIDFDNSDEPIDSIEKTVENLKKKIQELNEKPAEAEETPAETEVNPERVTRLRDSAERALRETGVAARQVIRMMLMLEDLLMLVYEKNGHKKVSAECALTVSPEKITLIIRDNGAQLDLTERERVQDQRQHDVDRGDHCALHPVFQAFILQ